MENFLFLATACFAAAFIDSIAGGGGLISFPAFIAAGLNPHLALGTNKLAAFFSTVGSTIGFARSGKINWNISLKIASFSFIGAILGVKTVLLIDQKYLYPIAFLLLVFVLIYTLYNKKMGNIDSFEGPTKENMFFGFIVAFVLGFYDGFFGPGTGSFIIFALIKIFKFDFMRASGNAKVLNLASNVSSVLTFMYYGKIAYFYALSIGVIMLIGASVGAKFAVSKGTKFIRPVFLIITTIVTIKMGMNIFN
ncbi:TSUP family transporter [Cetobacterium sp. 2A]|uniref:sulfite exporter TauE/SafE family protein n=1 Tax=unclassified Cetobacterium TaxID=2630983 RepID=UPI00163C86A9|nr:TSUP family transporter [Cetobacterium sp. 2A]MBC2855520.1 TSUP family transporter [Cetobacterium sp. 2A]